MSESYTCGQSIHFPKKFFIGNKDRKVKYFHYIFMTFIGSPYDYTYGYPVMEKRPSRPSLADYLRLAAMQYELDKEEAVEAAEAQNAGNFSKDITFRILPLLKVFRKVFKKGRST